jgi:hypothetical protein
LADVREGIAGGRARDRFFPAGGRVPGVERRIVADQTNDELGDRLTEG